MLTVEPRERRTVTLQGALHVGFARYARHHCCLDVCCGLWVGKNHPSNLACLRTSIQQRPARAIGAALLWNVRDIRNGASLLNGTTPHAMNPTTLIVLATLAGTVSAQGIQSRLVDGANRQPSAAAGAPSQASAIHQSTGRPGAQIAPGLPTEVIFDRPTDVGDLWAIGHTWKASFDRDGTTFIPFFGSDAAQNYPIRIDLAEASVGGQPLELSHAQPKRKGSSVRTERGALTEVFDLGLRQVEHSFVFEMLPNRGAITVELSIATDLTSSVVDGGVAFANEHGTVWYLSLIHI